MAVSEGQGEWADAEWLRREEEWSQARGTPMGVDRIVRICDEEVCFVTADCKRASRAAKHSCPSPAVQQMCVGIVKQAERALCDEGRERLLAELGRRSKASPLAAACSAGRGAATRRPSWHAALPVGDDEIGRRRPQRPQHQNKDVETHNQVASWLLGGENCAQMYDSLAESALRSNAVNACVTQRRETQGAAFQSAHLKRPESLGHL